jgi:RHS repeat-associated protein
MTLARVWHTPSAVSRGAASIVATLALLVVPGVASGQETVTYYTTDAIGSVRMVTDSGGAVIARYDYRPFGDPCGTACGAQGTIEKRQFAGKEKDLETSLDYFGARYYASANGRFTTVDPELDQQKALLDPQRWNRYTYVLNNPLRNVDPDGKEPVTVGLVLWGLYEIGSGIYDAYTAYRTWNDPNASAAERSIATGGLLAGILLPGGGYGTAGRAALKHVDDVADAAAGVRVIGKFPQYLELAEQIGAKRFNIPEKVWEAMSDAERLAANNKFLDRGILRRDAFRSTERISDVLKTKGFSWLRHEVDYLLKAGYRVAEDGYTLIPQ